MLNLIAWILVSVAGVYVAIGVAFAAFFVVRSVQRIDPAAEEGSIGFRVLVFPGSVVLWPLLMRRVQEGSLPPPERNAHRDAARVAARLTDDDAAGTQPVRPEASS